MAENLIKIRRALVSVWDKRGLEDLAAVFKDYNIEVISTGKTAKQLSQFGVVVKEVSDYTGSPEILAGRVKTLHPKIYAGLLYRRNLKEDISDLKSISAFPIDLVIVNLYPFKEAYQDKKVNLVEFIDIGGPTLLRAAAKNYRWVTVISDRQDYTAFIKQIKKYKGSTTLAFRRKMAGRAFFLTSVYDAWISAGMFKTHRAFSFEQELSFAMYRGLSLRYGENPHQRAGFYLPVGNKMVFSQLWGKQLSYNNIMDLSSAWEMVNFFSPEICAVVVKHSNPCGLALGKDGRSAYRRAYKADEISSFGGIIGINTEVDQDCAKEIINSGFRECVIAPCFTKEALDILKQKKNLRIVKIRNYKPGFSMKRAFNGFLLQENDWFKEKEIDLKIVSKKKPTKAQLKDLLFAFGVVRFVKSNAIVVAKSLQVIGVGAGQMSRVEAVDIALRKARDKAKGAVLASDAFFPKTDNIELCAKAGIKAIIQPSGSKADPDVIKACDKFGISLIFAPNRHFSH